jgi:hypothetical protein
MGHLVAKTRYFAREDELVIQAAGDELLVYDRATDTAHCLSASAAQLFRLCDGGIDHVDLLNRALLSEDALDSESAEAALAELEDLNLIRRESADGTPAGISRRQAVQRMASVGAAAFAAPFVVSAAIKTPYAAAYAGCGQKYQPCVQNGPKCCSGLVCTNGSTTGGGSTGSQRYCNVSTCTPKGGQPVKTQSGKCDPTMCCSGMCNNPRTVCA